MKQFHKISAIGLLAVVIGIITVGPAMADKDDSSWGKNKIDICHFDKENGKYVELSIPEKKAKGHAKNHENDKIPAPPEGCPEEDAPEIGTESDGGVNMDEFMEDLTRHDEVITEITDSECSPGEMVTGFGPNGELLCSPDNTGEDNKSQIISRTASIDLLSQHSMHEEYSCESGEILVGGVIDVPEVETPLFITGIMLNNSEQTYVVSINRNNNAETVPVTVTYLCFVI